MSADDQARRWRLVLGGDADSAASCGLSPEDIAMDAALAALYGVDADSDPRTGGLGGSAPRVARWLGDIRQYFPNRVVEVMQKDAIERLGLKKLILEPEVLETLTPDVNLAATLISLSQVMPKKAKETARMVVRKVCDDLERKLGAPMREAVRGALNRATRNNRPRHHEIDWSRTLRANLSRYQPTLNTVIPEQLIGYGRKRSSMRDIVLCIDQSGSMANSVVYASIFGAVLASLKAVSTRLVVFDTAIIDLSEKLDDPVDVLFGVQLGGGTDINGALAYCQSLIRRPQDTIVVLISDLIEGGIAEQMLARASAIQRSGAQMVALLALSDEGKPVYDHHHAAALAGLGIPAFACSPDAFADLMAAAIERHDLGLWAAQRGFITERAADSS
ncbi:MAG: VWA domain-containing protein [Nevskia sp.]|jgi:Mg-chelatase subunit ChlD|nr:VWA domain-containing protein [Nevskia sp.]MCK9385032.1 VWA domain-containing protein [Nevskia sp.]